MFQCLGEGCSLSVGVGGADSQGLDAGGEVVLVVAVRDDYLRYAGARRDGRCACTARASSGWKSPREPIVDSSARI